MAAKEADIRAAVKALVEGVTGIGVVYDYERWAPRWPEYLDLFKTAVGEQDQIRGWTVTVEGIENAWEAYEFHRKVFRFVVRGYLGLDDSAGTEKVMAGLAEDVIEKLEQYPRLNGTLTNGTYADAQWPRVETLEPRMFGAVLCHYVEIRGTVFEKGPVSYQE